MKKKLSDRSKLKLSRTLVRKLDVEQLSEVAGAAPTKGRFCGPGGGTQGCNPTDGC